jgi:hypothetical protein
MKIICILLCPLLTICCNITGPSFIQPGTYEGTFSITYFSGTDSAFTIHSQTTFTFNDTGWYTCRGSKVYTPPAGGGKYHVWSKNLLELRDLVFHTAEFDWTLILNGYFHLTQSGTNLSLVQDDKTHARHRYIEIQRVSP